MFTDRSTRDFQNGEIDLDLSPIELGKVHPDVSHDTLNCLLSSCKARKVKNKEHKDHNEQKIEVFCEYYCLVALTSVKNSDLGAFSW